MPKSYSAYKHKDIETLGIILKRRSFIGEILPIIPTPYLQNTLEMAAEMSLITEKAKSEFIIAPVLYEIVRKNIDKVSFFSGHNLDVDKSLGLKGFCDFLLTKNPESTFIKDPIFCIVEAKNDNLENGVPQCIAEMYAAKIFNERHQKPIDIIYGCVTTGYLWQFLKLEQQVALQDATIYTLSDITDILGILQFIVES